MPTGHCTVASRSARAATRRAGAGVVKAQGSDTNALRSRLRVAPSAPLIPSAWWWPLAVGFESPSGMLLNEPLCALCARLLGDQVAYISIRPGSHIRKRRCAG